MRTDYFEKKVYWGPGHFTGKDDTMVVTYKFPRATAVELAGTSSLRDKGMMWSVWRWLTGRGGTL